MEINFKKVHTGKDIAISSTVILGGAGLFLVNKGVGICIVACGLLMLLLYKGGYKKDGRSVMLVKKSEDLCKACRTSIIEFLNGQDTTPSIKKGNEGGSVRLDVYYNQAADIAYVQLYDFCNYTYEPATDIVELNGNKANKLIAQL